MDRTHPLFPVLRDFAATMAREFDTADMLYELCLGARTVLGADGAGVSVDDGSGRLEFITATGEPTGDLERTQQRHQVGPCVSAFQTGTPTVVRDLDDVEAWPSYRAEAERVGFRAMVGLPLVVGDQRIGALNVYSRARRVWADDDLAAAEVLADVASAYLLRAGALESARRLNDQLQEALDSRVAIEQAKGALGSRHGISVDEAFERVRRFARSHNESIRNVAQRVVDGDLDLPE